MKSPSEYCLTYRVALSVLLRFVALLSVVLLFFAFNTTVFAQEEGVSISPAVIDETLDPGVEQSFTMKVTNLNDRDQKFYVFARNIKGTNNGVPIFVSDDLEATGYELADWITLSVDEIELPARGSVNLDFKISVPDNASPGGHFGGVFISVDPPEIEKSGAAVGYQVANIIDIRVNGDVVEEAQIRQFSTSKYLHGSQNVTFDVTIQNEGNVMIRPSGPLEIFNMLGKQVGNLTFNTEQFGVFPGERKVFNNIVWEGDSVGFGRYEAILSPVYGDYGAKKTMSSTVTFWILPMSIIGPALGVLAFILLTVYVFVRIYIKRSLAHMNYGRRIISRRRKTNSSVTLLVIVVTLTVTALFLIVLLALFA